MALVFIFKENTTLLLNMAASSCRVINYRLISIRLNVTVFIEYAKILLITTLNTTIVR